MLRPDDLKLGHAGVEAKASVHRPVLPAIVTRVRPTGLRHLGQGHLDRPVAGPDRSPTPGLGVRSDSGSGIVARRGETQRSVPGRIRRVRFRINVAALLRAVGARLPSANSTAATTRPPESITVSTVGSFEVTHTVHRDTDLDSFSKTMPPASADYFEVSEFPAYVSGAPYVIAVVEVRLRTTSANARLAARPRLIETTFKGSGIAPLVRRWPPVEENHSGRWTAVFVLPDSFREGETRLVP